MPRCLSSYDKSQKEDEHFYEKATMHFNLNNNSHIEHINIISCVRTGN